jgi:type IV secretory pathway VirB2 component (pilin)
LWTNAGGGQSQGEKRIDLTAGDASRMRSDRLMEQSQDFRKMVFRMAEAAEPKPRRWLKLRESVETMILGTLSTSVGVIVLIVGLQGLLGIQNSQWHDLWQGVPVLSPRFAVASIIGEVLGLAGLTLGKIRLSAISPLSAVGTIVCLIQMYLFFAQIIYMQFR